MSHRFTGQELDPETGLYAFPARNYDPRTSRWLSADPALEEYLPIAPTSDEAREHNQNLPGGGVFDVLNLAVYHYTSNNPLKYIDPTGAVEIDVENKIIIADLGDEQDMAAAAELLWSMERYGFSVVAMSEDGSVGLGFASYGDMAGFMDGADPGAGELPGYVGMALDLLSSALAYGGATTASNVVGGVGAAISGGQIVADIFAGQNVDPMDVADLLGSVSGFAHPMLPLAYYAGKGIVDLGKLSAYVLVGTAIEWANRGMAQAGLPFSYGSVPSRQDFMNRK